ncbi:unnamed protein product [Amoebophrya sp. A25]|nr:unnamed protein product [Amoebophrya sp. A25]|eukprot:GSA25T00008502001.1
MDADGFDPRTCRPVDRFARKIPRWFWGECTVFQEELWRNPQFYELHDDPKKPGYNGLRLKCVLCPETTNINGAHTPNSMKHKKSVSHHSKGQYLLAAAGPLFAYILGGWKGNRGDHKEEIHLSCAEELVLGVNVPKNYCLWDLKSFNDRDIALPQGAKQPPSRGGYRGRGSPIDSLDASPLNTEAALAESERRTDAMALRFVQRQLSTFDNRQKPFATARTEIVCGEFYDLAPAPPLMDRTRDRPRVPERDGRYRNGSGHGVQRDDRNRPGLFQEQEARNMARASASVGSVSSTVRDDRFAPFGWPVSSNGNENAASNPGHQNGAGRRGTNVVASGERKQDAPVLQRRSTRTTNTAMDSREQTREAQLRPQAVEPRPLSRAASSSSSTYNNLPSSSARNYVNLPPDDAASSISSGIMREDQDVGNYYTSAAGGSSRVKANHSSSITTPRAADPQHSRNVNAPTRVRDDANPNVTTRMKIVEQDDSLNLTLPIPADARSRKIDISPSSTASTSSILLQENALYRERRTKTQTQRSSSSLQLQKDYDQGPSGLSGGQRTKRTSCASFSDDHPKRSQRTNGIDVARHGAPHVGASERPHTQTKAAVVPNEAADVSADSLNVSQAEKARMTEEKARLAEEKARMREERRQLVQEKMRVTQESVKLVRREEQLLMREEHLAQREQKLEETTIEQAAIAAEQERQRQDLAQHEEALAEKAETLREKEESLARLEAALPDERGQRNEKAPARQQKADDPSSFSGSCNAGPDKRRVTGSRTLLEDSETIRSPIGAGGVSSSSSIHKPDEGVSLRQADDGGAQFAPPRLIADVIMITSSSTKANSSDDSSSDRSRDSIDDEDTSDDTDADADLRMGYDRLSRSSDYIWRIRDEKQVVTEKLRRQVDRRCLRLRRVLPVLGLQLVEDFQQRNSAQRKSIMGRGQRTRTGLSVSFDEVNIASHCIQRSRNDAEQLEKPVDAASEQSENADETDEEAAPADAESEEAAQADSQRGGLSDTDHSPDMNNFSDAVDVNETDEEDAQNPRDGENVDPGNQDDQTYAGDLTDDPEEDSDSFADSENETESSCISTTRGCDVLTSHAVLNEEEACSSVGEVAEEDDDSDLMDNATPAHQSQTEDNGAGYKLSNWTDSEWEEEG